MAIVYLNGEFLDRERASLPLDDRGFLFGDGIYEVSRAVNGVIFREQDHWTRLASGLKALGISCEGHLDPGRFREIHARLLEENGLTRGEATVYMQVTRGAAPRTHHFPAAGTAPTVYAAASAFEIPRKVRDEGVAAITVPDIRWARCDIKTVNLLPNVMAKQTAKEAGAFEALFIRDGVLLEGASSNLFGMVDGELRTYPLCNYILPGVTRKVVLEIAAELGIEVAQKPIFAEEIPRLQELFVTGTASDVTPIVTLDGRAVGSGRPGGATVALQRRLEELQRPM